MKTKKIIIYGAIGVGAIGLGLYAYNKYQAGKALQSSLAPGGNIAVDSSGNPAKGSIPTEVVQQLNSEQLKQVTQTNPEVLKQITPQQAVDLFDTTPGLTKILPGVEDAVRAIAASGGSIPTPSPAPTTTVKSIAPVTTVYKAPTYTTPTYTTSVKLNSGTTSFKGLGEIERLVL